MGRYPALERLASAYRVVMALTVVLVVIGVGIAASEGFETFIAALLAGCIVVYVAWLMCASFVALIQVQVDIEANTRRQADTAERLLGPTGSGSRPTA
jgi:hypothetical protein